MFGKQKPKPEPAPEAKPENTDIEDIKRWIAEVASPKFKDLAEREQRNRDNISYTNERCANLNKDTRKLWKEKDAEKQASDKEIAKLKKTIRDLKDELNTKANRAKPAPGKKPGA